MARFYFDVREGSRFAPDAEGDELDSEAEAEAQAIEIALHLGRDRLPTSDARTFEIEVRKEGGAPLLLVRVSLEVVRKRNGAG
jgi:hypothetical protein